MHSGSTLPSLIQSLDILVSSIQSQLCYCQFCFLAKHRTRNIVSSRARISTLQFAAWPGLGTNETMTTWMNVWFVAVWKTRFIHFLSCLISLTGSLAASRVVWILLTEDLQLRCTFYPIFAVDIARVVKHIVLCIVVSCWRSKPCGSVRRGWDYCHAPFCFLFHATFSISDPSCGPGIAYWGSLFWRLPNR